MSVKLFVGGLSFTTSTEGLREAFARFGPVQSAAVMTDRETGRSRGFGFVEMASPEEAERAISALNGSNLDGRMIRVDKATPKGSGGAGGAGGFRPRPAGGGYGGPRPDRPAGAGYGGPPRSGGGGGYAGADRRPSGGPGGGRSDRPPMGGFGETPGGGGRRGQQRRGGAAPGGWGEQRSGQQRKGPGGQRKGGPGGKPGPKGKTDYGGSSGRGRPGSDGEYRWGR